MVVVVAVAGDVVVVGGCDVVAIGDSSDVDISCS